jgi:hypothetical protein
MAAIPLFILRQAGIVSLLVVIHLADSTTNGKRARKVRCQVLKEKTGLGAFLVKLPARWVRIQERLSHDRDQSAQTAHGFL